MVNPSASEIWYDGIDQDCDGRSDFDQDGDGADSHLENGGADCDDTDPDSGPCGSSSALAATTCEALHAAYPALGDQVYWLDPDGDGDTSNAWRAYCDMTTDGGGWMLVAKVHRYSGGADYDEPIGWFAQLGDECLLRDPLSYNNRSPGWSSHGAARMASVDAELARFVLVAGDDPEQRARWYKEVDAGIGAWFSGAPHDATTVCTDLAMTSDCTQGALHAGAVFTPL